MSSEGWEPDVLSPLSTRPQVSRTLRRDNAIAAVLHLVQATAVVALATGFALPVTAAYLAGPPRTAVSDPVVLFDVPTGAAVATFLALSALAHLLVCTSWWRLYITDLNRNRNRARWVEYSLSSSIMIGSSS